MQKVTTTIIILISLNINLTIWHSLNSKISKFSGLYAKINILHREQYCNQQVINFLSANLMVVNEKKLYLIK